MIIPRSATCLLILGLVAAFGCRPIHNLPGIGPQIGDIFPTEDRYERCGEAPIALDRPGNTTEVEFVPPFRGGYIVSIASAGPRETQSALAHYMHDHNTSLSVTFELIQDGEVKLQRSDDSFGIYFREFAGFQLRGGFECPEDIEFAKSATLRILVVTPDRTLEDKFGPFVVFVRKISDF